MTSYVLLRLLANGKRQISFFDVDGFDAAMSEGPLVQEGAPAVKAWYILPINIVSSSTTLHEAQGQVPYPVLDVVPAENSWKLFTMSLNPSKGKGEVYVKDGRSLKDAKEILDAAELLTQIRNVEVSIIDGSKVKVLYVSGKAAAGYLTYYKAKWGLSTRAKAKVVKRLGQLIRSYLLAAVLGKDEIDLVLWRNSQVEASIDETNLDGAILIHRTLLRKIIARTVARGYLPESVLEDVKDCTQWNGRLFIPAGWLKGDLAKGCMLKGQFFITDKGPENRILTHECNFKKEIMLAAGEQAYVYLSPQPGHGDGHHKHASTISSQFIMNQRWLFPLKEVSELLINQLAEKEAAVQDGSWCDRPAALIQQLYRGRLEMGHSTMSRLQIGEWAAMGRSPLELPVIYSQAATAGLDTLFDPERWQLRVKIPYSLHWQVITDTVASEIVGNTFQVPQGTILLLEKQQLLVLNAEDYRNNRLNHGNPDQDDFYDLIIRRKPDGYAYGVLLRSPNDLGEHSIWKIAYNRLPQGWTVEELPEFPTKPAPKQASVRTVPADPDIKDEPYAGKAEWNAECVGIQFNMRRAFSVTPGAYSLVKQAYNWIIGNDSWVPPITCEWSVDTPVQTPTPAGLALLEKATMEVLRKILDSGKKIPRTIAARLARAFWQNKEVAAEIVAATDNNSNNFDTLFEKGKELVEDSRKRLLENIEQNKLPIPEEEELWENLPRKVTREILCRELCQAWQQAQDEVREKAYPFTVTVKKRTRTTDYGWNVIRSRQKVLLEKHLEDNSDEQWPLILGAYVHLSQKSERNRHWEKVLGSWAIWGKYLQAIKTATRI